MAVMGARVNTERIMAGSTYFGTGEREGGLARVARLLDLGVEEREWKISRSRTIDPIPIQMCNISISPQSPLRLLTQGYRLGQVCWQLENCLLSPLCLRLHLCFFLPQRDGRSEKSQPKTPEL